MEKNYSFTRHARQRSAGRSIPQFVTEAILSYGNSWDAGAGARKFSLTKEGMRELRQDEGRSFTNTINAYRCRNVYVIASAGRVVTVAYASKSLFH